MALQIDDEAIAGLFHPVQMRQRDATIR